MSIYNFVKTRRVQRQFKRSIQACGYPSVIFTDFDGCLTDDRVYTNEHGEEFVGANRKDGLAVTLLKLLDIEVVIVSREKNRAVVARANKLGVTCYHGLLDKPSAVRSHMEKIEDSRRVFWYVGNDLNDLPAIAISPFSLAPRDAVHEVRRTVDVVLNTNGGKGVLAEITRHLLRIEQHSALQGNF